MSEKERTLDSVAELVNEHSKSLQKLSEINNRKNEEIKELKNKVEALEKINRILTPILHELIERCAPEIYKKSKDIYDGMEEGLRKKGYTEEQIREGLNDYFENGFKC